MKNASINRNPEPHWVQGCEPFAVHTSPSRTLAFGLEPKFASQISIGALPLWRFASLHCHPDDVGKFFSHTLLRFEPYW
jgi:hypothetical protein